MTVEQFQTAASISENLQRLNRISEELDDAINYVIESKEEIQTIVIIPKGIVTNICVSIPTSIFNESLTDAKAKIEVQIKDLNEQFKAL